VSRGKPKPKISDISRTPPTREELDALAASLESDELHPITAAILGAVLVEHELENELRRRLRCNDDTWGELLSDIGPLRTFHSKIVMGCALRMYNDDVRFDLNIVRNIRNQFAHSKKLVSFIIRSSPRKLGVPNTFLVRAKILIMSSTIAMGLNTGTYRSACF
jgi:hypothetical protein